MLLCQTDFGELCDLKIAEILKLFLWQPVSNYFVGFVHIERARHDFVFGIVGEISLLGDGGSTLPICKSFLAKNFVHVQNPQSSL